MNLPIKISNDDFFSLMKHRIFSSYSRSATTALGKSIIFKETIDALKLLENFALEIKEGVWEGDLQDLKFEHSERKKQLDELCHTFNELRLKEYLFPYPEMFNHLFFKSVYTSYQLLDQLPDVDLQESILPMIPYVRDKIDHGIRKQFELEGKVSNTLNQHKEFFDTLLRNHKSVYVLVLDIYIERFFQSLSGASSESQEMKLHQIAQIKMTLAHITHLQWGITKIETHFKEGLNLHCILILKHTKDFSETNTIEVLKQKIHYAMDGLHVDIRNWNTVIHKNYSEIAVGLIKNSQPKNVEAFKYWILSFFYTLDLHIQPYLPSQLKNHLAINETLDIYLNMVTTDNLNRKNYITVESSLKELEKANKALSKFFQPFLSENERKSAWSTRCLSKTSQAYIEAVKHYYREIEPDPEKLQSMMNIEIFIETLLSTELQAFELSVSGDQEVLTRQILRKAVTRLGRQFILLGENEVDDLHHPRYAFLIQLFFEKSRDALQHLTGSVVPRHAIEEVNHLILALRKLYTSSYKGIRDQSIQKISNHSYKKYIRRLDDITELLTHLFLRDCLVFRVTVELIPETEHISHPDLVILWTAFLHQAQRAKPLSWKTGYFGLWRVDEDQHFYADVFFVFDQRAVVDRDSIIQQLNDKWVEFVNHKAKSKLKLNEKPEFKHCRIQGKPLMIAEGEYASDHLFIESTNKARKSDFLQKIIPAFLSHSLFGEAYHETYKQTGSGLLIKSSIAVASRKNTPSTKSIRQKALKESVERSEIDDDQ